MTQHQMYKEMLRDEVDEYRADPEDERVQELVELRVEDFNRKGCIAETFKTYCRGDCDSCVDGVCPLENWMDRHPEFKNDELTKRIKALETELYGWHKPPTHKDIVIEATTVEELLKQLKSLPKSATTERLKIKIPI